ncbi:hypothetical protein ACFV6F_00865 [Kitasatospora phosalacinea]|uniref:hypothetical protein n=1 Tax=Kitasatospora phosalacinea TaxID=2065 RepID=UPI00365208E8
MSNAQRRHPDGRYRDAVDTDARLLADLLQRAAELKGELVAHGQSARFDRWLTPLLLEAAGPERRLDETDAIRIIDHFLLRYRLPDGATVVDRFVAGRRGLTEADREMLLGWRDPVEGIFEVRRKDGDCVFLLNLVDDLEYRTYSNVGRAAFRGVSKGVSSSPAWCHSPRPTGPG